jgi:hypothetical protein
MDSDAGHDLEAGVLEVTVEGECPVQIVAAQKSGIRPVERSARQISRIDADYFPS